MLECVFLRIPETSYKELWQRIKQREEQTEAHRGER